MNPKGASIISNSLSLLHSNHLPVLHEMIVGNYDNPVRTLDGAGYFPEYR